MYRKTGQKKFCKVGRELGGILVISSTRWKAKSPQPYGLAGFGIGKKSANTNFRRMFEVYKSVKLTKKTAWQLISRIHPRLNISKDATPPEVAIFRASTGPEGLEIRCENDWFNHNGRIKLTLIDGIGGNQIIQYFHPDTLNRDFGAEQDEKDDATRQVRKDWVQMVGRDMAHKLVDQYWGG